MTNHETESVYSAIPVSVEFSSSSVLDEDDLSVDLLSLQGKHQVKQDNQNGFIFGLRTGFASQFVLGLLIFFGYHDALSEAMDSIAGVASATAVICAVTVIMGMVSNKLHSCLKRSPSGNQEHMDQDFHLLYGTLLGMYLAWVLFDLIMENGFTILGIHSTVTLVGYCRLRHSKDRQQRKRRAVNDDLLKSLDLA